MMTEDLLIFVKQTLHMSYPGSAYLPKYGATIYL